MAITPLPTPPTRSDPTNFAVRADAFLAALPTFQSEANTLAVGVNADEVAAAASAATASTAASTATTQAGIATTQADLANTSRVAAQLAETNAEAAQAAAELAFDNFDDRYLGAKASDPTTDNDGNALLEGAAYWNSASNELRFWDGAIWQVANLTSHISDTTGAHDGTAITNTPAGGISATNVQAAINELDSEKEPSITAGTASQYWRGNKTWADFFTDVRASTLTGLSTAVNAVITAGDTVLSALGKLQKQVSDNLSTLTGHTGASSGAHAATAISNTPAGTIAATTVQAAINELDTEKVAKSGDTMTGNLDFSGTALRIRGDLSNATVANRLALQSSTTNGNTSVSVLPNGTSTTAAVTIFNSSDPANSGYAQVVASSGAVELLATNVGTGAAIPLRLSQGVNPVLTVGTNRRVALTPNNEPFALQLNNGATTNGPFLGSAGADIFVMSTSAGTEVMRTDASRNFLVTGSGGLGYGVGSGGTVTQATSKTTAVTLNKPSGQITMNAAALAAGVVVGFLVNDTNVAATDCVVVNIAGGVSSTANYSVFASSGGANAFGVFLKNESGGSLSEAVVLNFVVVKGANT